METIEKFFNFSHDGAGKVGIEIEIIGVDHNGKPSKKTYMVLKKILHDLANVSYTWWNEKNSVIRCEYMEKLTTVFKKIGIKPELFLRQIEAVFGPHIKLSELKESLIEKLSLILKTCKEYDISPILAGLPPGKYSLNECDIFPEGRYKGILDAHGTRLLLGFSSGFHIHVGLPNLEEAIYVLNYCRRYITELAALGLNAHVYNGGPSRSGALSRRLENHSFFVQEFFFRFIQNPFHLMDLLKKNKTLRDCWWAIRLTGHGTIEFRMFDGQNNVQEILMIVSVVRALVAKARKDYVDGIEISASSDEISEFQALQARTREAAMFGFANDDIRQSTLDMLESIGESVHDGENEYHRLAIDRVTQRICAATRQAELWKKSGGSIKKYVQLLVAELEKSLK